MILEVEVSVKQMKTKDLLDRERGGTANERAAKGTM